MVRFGDFVGVGAGIASLWPSGSRLDRTDITPAFRRTGASAADSGPRRCDSPRGSRGGPADGQSSPLEIAAPVPIGGPSGLMPIPGRQVFQEFETPMNRLAPMRSLGPQLVRFCASRDPSSDLGPHQSTACGSSPPWRGISDDRPVQNRPTCLSGRNCQPAIGLVRPNLHDSGRKLGGKGRLS